MVLSTRRVRTRGEDGVAPREMVEIEVADPSSLAPEPNTVQAAYAAYSREEGAREEFEPSASGATAPGQRLERLRRISEHVQEMAERVDGLAVGDVEAYPLAAALRATGTTEPTIRDLAVAFDGAARGGDPSVTAARRHLSRTLRGTGAVHLDRIRGEHWLLGRAGVGKTSLALQLAGTLRHEGVRVALLALCPQHDGDLERLRSAGEALGISSFAVYDAAEMQEARDRVADVDVVLVDTPCFLGCEWTARPGDEAHRHLVVPLGEDRSLLRDQLRQAQGWTPDTLAVTQMDLYPRPGRLVDLAAEVSRPVSFLQGRRDGRLVAQLARGEALIRAVLADEESTPLAAAEAGA